MSGLIEAGELVDRYAAAFFGAIDPALAAVHAERQEALGQGIPANLTRALYRVEFSDIQPAVLRWLAAYPRLVQKVASQANALPGITDRDARPTRFSAELDRLAAAVAPIMFSGSVVNASLAISAGDPPLELLYTLLEIFDSSHALNLREKTVVPASLAMLVQQTEPHAPQQSPVPHVVQTAELDPMACFRHHGLPLLAPGVHAGEVYYAAEEQAGPKIWYPRELWRNL